MSIIKPEYRFLAPKGKYLADTVVLAQAWKKTQHYVRQHNWYADGLELDVTMANLEQHLASWKEEVREESFQTSEMRLVPAPKHAQWMFKPQPEIDPKNLLNLNFEDLDSDPAFNDWLPRQDGTDSATQRLRPLAHLSIRDQTLATAVMMCLAEVIETAQGNPATGDGQTGTVSFGNRLQCRWVKSIDDTELAKFSWGSSNSYRKYFQDYRTFLARPRKACAKESNALSRGKDLYVIALDIQSFFDQIDVKALIGELKRIELKHRERFALPKDKHASSLFWKRTAKILNWRWQAADHSLAPLIHNDETLLRLGLPQGLMASGFFANAYLIGFDTAMKQALHSVINAEADITLIDYCRYVDDLRLVVSAPRTYSEAGQRAILGKIQRYVTEKLQAHCQRIGAAADKKLELSERKSRITPFQAVTTSGSLSNLMEMLNAELSTPFDFESLTQAAGGLEGLLSMAEQIDASDPVLSRLKLSAIAAPPAEVRDDTLKRFVAGRLAQTLRQRLAMTAPPDTIPNDELLQELVSDGRAISHEFEATARKLIKCWAENPSLALLLRTGLDLFPHPKLLGPVLEALEVKLFAGPAHNTLEALRQIRTAEYVAADLLRAGAQETGLRMGENYPNGVDIAGYREELAAFARRLLSERSNTPWYVLQQASLYLAVMSDFSLASSSVMKLEELSDHYRLARVMRSEPMYSERLLEALPVALVAQQIAPNGHRFGSWIREGLKRTEDVELQKAIITMIAMNRADLLEYVLLPRSRATSAWKLFVPPTMRVRTKKVVTLAESGGAVLNLFSVIQAPDSPFRQENGLLLLTKALLSTDGVYEKLRKGLAVTDVRIECEDWGRVSALPNEDGFLKVTLDDPEVEPCYLYATPDWVAREKSWLYALGRILRSTMTGEPDFTTRRYLIAEDVTRYRGLASSWSKRRIGLLNSAKGLLDEPTPISPWLSSFLSSLLQWPGIDVAEDAASIIHSQTPSELLRYIDRRIEAQRALFGQRSNSPMYVIPVDEVAKLEARPMRIAVVQTMRPTHADFDEKDPLHWSPAMLAQHRRHLAETCRLARQNLRTWYSALPAGTDRKSDAPIVDLILFPELTVHPQHVFLLRHLADDLKASVFAGLTFIHSEKLSATINQGLWLLRSESSEHGRSFQYVWQGKKYPTELECEMGVKSYRPHITLVEFPVGERSPTRVAAAICYDATDLDLAADLRDRSDIFLVAAMNKDVQTFDNMVSALNFHMYQPVVLANSGEFGGSTAQAPLPKHEHLIAHLHGNNQVGVSVFEIDPEPFKSINSGKIPKELKGAPAGYLGRPGK